MRTALKIKFFIIFLLLAIANTVVAQTALNAGFVDGIWYSKTPFFDGDEVRIYAVIQNQSGFDISGEVEFFSDDKLLSKSDFSAVNGRLIEKWADWKVIYGEHTISVKISNVEKSEIGQDPVSVGLIENIFISEKHIIDIDTDKDGIGNKDDFDDDGDGISDMEEIKTGANPLVFDLPIDKSVNLPTNGRDNIQNKNADENNKLEKAKVLTKNITEKTIEATKTVFEKTKEIIEQTTMVLEEQKEKIEQELLQKQKEKLLKGELPQINEDKNLFVAAIVGNIPSLKELYNLFLGIFIYILNSWWILLGGFFILLCLLWKMLKRKFGREEF